MKQCFIHLLLFIFTTSIFTVKAQSGSGWDWSSTSGIASQSPGKRVIDVATDAAGNVYATGRFLGSMTLGGFTVTTTGDGTSSGNYDEDAFLVKYNAAGTVQWLKSFGTAAIGSNQIGQVVTVDGDGNIYIGGSGISGTTTNNAFMVKYDANGNLLWSKTNFNLFEINGINISPDGNPIVMESNQGSKNIYKLNKTDGSQIWKVQNTNAGSNSTTTYKDFLDANGNVYYTCFSAGATTANIAGQSITTTSTASFIASLDNNGSKRWVTVLNNAQVQLGYSVDKNGKSYVVRSGGSGGSPYTEIDNTGAITTTLGTIPFEGKIRVKDNAIYGFTVLQGTVAAYSAVYGDKSFVIPATSNFAVGVVIKYNLATQKAETANSFEITGQAYNAGTINAIDIASSGKIIVGGFYGNSVKFGTTLKTSTTTATLFPVDLFIAQYDGNNVAAQPTTTWLGTANNMNFSDAANWSNSIPNGSTNVIIPAGKSNYPNNITTASYMGKLDVAAGVTIALPIDINVPLGIVNNGAIEIVGPGTFNGSFNTSQLVPLSGSGKIVIKNSNVSYFGFVDLNNSLEINATGNVTSNGGVINGSLILTSGVFSGGGITLSNPNATITNTATSYITGTLKRRINTSGTYNFPVGNSTINAQVTLTLTNITGPQYISVNIPDEFAQTAGTTPNITLGSQSITTKLNKNQWNVIADADVTGGSYAISLEGHGYTNGVTDASRYVVIKRAANDKPWSFNGTNGTSTQVSSVATASASGITSFSTFGIGIASASVAAGTATTTSNWTGNANTTWNNAANWDNGIPNSLISAVIGTGKTNYPLVYATTDNARSLQVNTNTTIKVPYNFLINTDIINDGTIEVTGASSTYFSGFGNSTNGYANLSGSGKLLFTTASPGNISGTYNNSLELNKSNNSLAFTNLFVGGSINFISGYLSGNSSTLTMTNPDATITGSSSYYVTGTLNRAVNATGTYNFPIGTGFGTNYAPVTISTTSLAGTTMLSALFYNTIYGSTAFTPIDGEPVSALNVGQWTITPNNPATAGTINLTLQGTGYSNGVTDLSRYVLLKAGVSGTSWERVVGATFTQSSGVITATINNLPALTEQTIYIIGIKGLTTQWTGAANNQSWTTGSNWTNGVPDFTYKAVFVAGSPNYPLTITTSNNAAIFTIASGVTLKLPQNLNIQQGIINNGTVEVSGTSTFGGFANNPSNLSGTGKLLFTSNSPSSIGTGTLINNGLELNRTGNFTINTPTITGSLILTNGTMVGDITLSNPNATITASATSYVNGKIIQSVNASGSYNFPVGNATKYAPVTLQLNSISGTQKITTSFTNTINGTAPNTTAGGQTVTQLLDAGIWTITPDVALTGGNYNVTLEGRGFTNSVTDATRYVVLKRANSSSSWAFFGNNGTATYSATAITATAGNINGFSDFAIGIANASVPTTLPVTYTYFTAQKSNTQVVIQWQTAQEINNSHFNIQHSNNAINWITIGKVDAGNNIGLNNYSYNDAHPSNGINYYRLQQVDKDGKTSFSDVRRVDMATAKASLKLYPNPVIGNTITLDYGTKITKPLTYKIIDVVGRTMQTGNLTNQQESINLNNLQKGNYRLVVSDGQTINMIKM